MADHQDRRGRDHRASSVWDDRPGNVALLACPSVIRRCGRGGRQGEVDGHRQAVTRVAAPSVVEFSVLIRTHVTVTQRKRADIADRYHRMGGCGPHLPPLWLAMGHGCVLLLRPACCDGVRH
jgi:hypothetical protein